MLTDADIQYLLQLPKEITDKRPSSGYREDNGHKRCDLDLRAVSSERAGFKVFIRQNERFIENFSIGLLYLTGERNPAEITLVRYNGSHGETSRSAEDHYAKPHIHRITETEIALGSTQPQERHRELTDRYSTFEQALAVFFGDISTTNHYDSFPELGQGRLL